MADITRLETATDAGLLRASLASSAAFRVLYDRHAERINAFLARRARDPGAALELTAETFAQAWLSRDRYADHDEGTIAPWLFGIALTCSRRRSAATPWSESRATDFKWSWIPSRPAPPTPGQPGLDDDLSAALAELPDGQRRAVELRIVADHAYDEVGRRLDISPQAARVRVHRGLKALRQRLSQS